MQRNPKSHKESQWARNMTKIENWFRKNLEVISNSSENNKKNYEAFHFKHFLIHLDRFITNQKFCRKVFEINDIM